MSARAEALDAQAMVLAKLPGPGVFREPRLIRIEIELAGAANDLARADFAQNLEMLLDRIGEQRRQRVGDARHLLWTRRAHEARQPRRGLRQIGERDAQRRGGIEQHAHGVAHHAGHRQRRNAAEAQGAGIAEGAAASRLIAIDQRHAGAAAQELPGRADADDARTDHDDGVAPVSSHFNRTSTRALPSSGGRCPAPLLRQFEFRPPLRRECHRRIRCIPLFSSAINTFDRKPRCPR